MSHRPKSHYRHMTPAKAAEMRRLYFARVLNQPQLARRYKLSQGSVSRIISGAVWAE